MICVHVYVVDTYLANVEEKQVSFNTSIMANGKLMPTYCLTSSLAGPCPVEAIRSCIQQLTGQFEKLKSATAQELQKAGIGVASLVDKITSLPAKLKEAHREFLKEYNKEFHSCKSVPEVFTHLNTHWDYLNYDMLAHLITGFSLSSLNAQLKEYKLKMQHFLNETSLEQFSEAEEEERYMEPPEGFKKLVSRHKFSPSTSLKEIDTFRRKFAHKYDLRACAIFLLSMRSGSVVITMLVPESLEMMLRSTDPEFFKEHSIVHLQFNDILIYEEVHMCVL